MEVASVKSGCRLVPLFLFGYGFALKMPYVLILVLDELGQDKPNAPGLGYKLLLASEEYEVVRQFLREDEYEPIGSLNVKIQADEVMLATV